MRNELDDKVGNAQFCSELLLIGMVCKFLTLVSKERPADSMHRLQMALARRLWSFPLSSVLPRRYRGNGQEETARQYD